MHGLESAVAVDTGDVLKYLRMGASSGDAALLGRIRELLAKASSAIRPACTWKRFPLCADGIVSGGGTLAVSGTLAAHLRGCRSAYLVCGTAGAEFDAFMRRVSAVSGADALIAQAIGTAAIEKLMDFASDEIAAELCDGESAVSRYSPGYGDFPLAAQRTILDLLDAPRRTGVSLTDSLLMVPSKSVSAVVGVRDLWAVRPPQK
jgi:hypothetical protein